MDRGAWPATVYGVTKVGHDLATKLLLLGSSAHEILQARIPDLGCQAWWATIHGVTMNRAGLKRFKHAGQTETQTQNFAFGERTANTFLLLWPIRSEDNLKT